MVTETQIEVVAQGSISPRSEPGARSIEIGGSVNRDVIGGDVIHGDQIGGNQYVNEFSGAGSARELRNRQLLLNMVKDSWVKGVLEESVPRTRLLNIGKEEIWVDISSPRVADIATPKKRSVPANQQIIDTFDKVKHLLILGDAGSGKTITMLEQASQLIKRAEDTATETIPVILNLSTWSGQSLDQWLVQELKTQYHIPSRIGQEWVNNDDLLLLLDGLDAVIPEKRRRACIEVINQFRQDHGLTKMIITSRLEPDETITDYFLHLQQLHCAIQLQSLTPAQIDQYFDAVGEKLAALRIVLETDEPLRELAQSPQMLDIMSRAYADIPVDALTSEELNTVEDRREHLFKTYIDRMVKLSPSPSYSPTQIKGWLSWLAQQMAEHNQTVFLIEQLQPSWLPTRFWRWVYALTSRFLSGLTGGVIGGVIFGYGVVPYLTGSYTGQALDGLILMLIGGLSYGLSVGVIDGLRFDLPHIPLSERWRNSLNKVLNNVFLCILLVWLVFGAFAWIIVI
jgi:hypothetical protein